MIAGYHLPAYLNYPDKFKLNAICDIRPEALEKFGEKAGVKERYTDFLEMLEKADIDAVDICTIHDQHEAQVVAAAKAGKQIFLEKPMGTNLKQCNNMVEAARKAGVAFMVGHDLRYMPHTLAIKRIIESGELGQVRMTRCVLIDNMPPAGFMNGHWLNDPKRSGGGMMISGIIHQVDLLRYFIGDVKTVYAVNRSIHEGYWDGREEYACAVLEFENGTICDIMLIGSSTRSPIGCQYTLYGDEGTIMSTQAESRVYQFGQGMIASKKRGNFIETFNYFAPIPPERGNLPTDDAFTNEILHFADCVSEHKEPLTSGRDNLGTVKVIFGIYESFKTGKKIDLAKM